AGDSSCGVRLHGSVISHSQPGTVDVKPELFDLVGPVEFDFRPVKAQAKLTPTCDRAATWDVTGVVGLDGKPVEAPECALRFDAGSRGAGCHGTQPLPVGSHGAVATIADPVSGCAIELPLDPVEVADPIQVVAQVEPTCAGALRYHAEVGSGGSAARSY